MKKILLVDYGSYYFRDVCLCLEEIGVEYLIFHYKDSIENIDAFNICGVVLTGGPGRVNNPKDPQLDLRLLDFKVPVLGICYGMQLLMHALGGRVDSLEEQDLGYSEMPLCYCSPINKNISNPTKVWMAHYDHVTRLAQGFNVYGKTDISIAMIGNEERRIYAVQYHPEAKKSSDDMMLFRNFIFGICQY